MVLSLFRTAAIMNGIHARAVRGSAASETAKRFGAQYTLVAKRAWALAQGQADT